MRVTCVICGDIVLHSEDLSAAPCGHTFHSVCLFQWIERSKSCPQCRSKCTEKSVVKLFFDTGSNDSSQLDPDALQQQLENFKFQIRLKEQAIAKHDDETDVVTKHNKGLREECKTLQCEVKARETTITALKSQLKYMDRATTEAQKARDEAKVARMELKLMQDVSNIISSSQEDVELMLDSYSGSANGMRGLATFCAILKKELQRVIDDRRKLRDELATTKLKLRELKQNFTTVEAELVTEKQKNTFLQQDFKSVESENCSLRKKVVILQQAISSPSGDVKTSALNRLINESPAPVMLKRPRLTCPEEDFLTPEISSRTKRQREDPSATDDVGAATIVDATEANVTNNLSSSKVNDVVESPYLQLKSSLMGPIISCQNNRQGLVLQNQNKYNFFNKTVVTSGMSKVTSMQREGMGYDGLGGHHKVDKFPTGRKCFTVIFPKKKSVVTVVNKARVKNQIHTTASIKNFFQTDFGDEF